MRLVVLRVHYAEADAGLSGRARGVCGRWSASYTRDPARTNCRSCRKALAANDSAGEE